jgi:protein-tyrosine phosphatase
MTKPDAHDLAWMRVDIAGTRNLRDLGGLTTPEGRRIRPGVLFRAEALVDLPVSPHYAVLREDNAADLHRLGIRTVIDLRSELESERKPSAWPRATGARAVQLPIAEGVEGTDTWIMEEIRLGRRLRFDDVDLAEYYCGILDRRAAVFAAAVHEIVEPGSVPVLVHCAAGKDRTGLLLALVLECLGFSRDVVVQEYALTGALVPDQAGAYADQVLESGGNPADFHSLFETPAWAMTMALEYGERTYGDAPTYLVEQGGLDPDDVTRLVDVLLEQPG